MVELKKRATPGPLRLELRLGALLFLLVLALAAVLGCGGGDSPEMAVEQFYTFWGEQDYASMYELLDSASREAYSVESFTEHYAGIDQLIALTAVEVKEIEKRDDGGGGVSLSLSAALETDTVGTIPVRYPVELSRGEKGAPWLLRWHPGLIFPELTDGRTVDLTRELPGRGRLTDRNGALLAGPGLYKEVGAVPGVYGNEQEFAAAVGRLLGLSRETVTARLHQSWVRKGDYVPLTVLDPGKESLLEQLHKIPGVMIKEIERRSYPAGKAAAHLTGYLGEITAEELAEKEGQGYREGDLLGKSGLEAALEERLAGKSGCTLRILEADGKEAALIATRERQQGEDIALTVDLELQEFAAAALGEKRGAVVALDPRNGEILALCSNPAFDPNDFIVGLTAAEWQELQGDPGNPFLNRALSGLYPPGSSFKPFTAAAAVDAQVLDPAKTVVITGERWQPGESWGDYFVRRVRTDVERLDLNAAMKYSDNIYFAQAGLALGQEKFTSYGERFGFDEQIDFLLPVARSRLSQGGIRSEVQLADSSFGQGEVMMTPLQGALLYSAFAGEGSLPQPRLLHSEESALWKKEAVSAAAAKTVHRALVEVLHGEGAAAAAGAVPGFKAAGKTGTAETDGDKGNICWYVTYGPAEAPALVVAAVIEEGGWASAEALPVGRAVLERFLLSTGR